MGMRPLRYRRKPAGWPFFLLVAAWFCANSPQSVAINILEWAKGARHFSHQLQLKSEVLSLLAGKYTPAVLMAAQAPSKAPTPVPISNEATIKKIDLSAPRQADGLLGSPGSCNFAVYGDLVPKCERAEPAFLPPRSETGT
jgi:hypothetical protein